MDKKPFTMHPFLFAAFPVLFLFAHNIRELEFSAIIIPITLILFFTLLLLFLARLFLKDGRKAAALSSLVLVIFFSYGPFSKLMEKASLFVGKFVIGPRKFTFMSGCILLCFGAYRIIKTRNNLYNVTKILNVAASCLVISSLLTIGMYKITSRVSGGHTRGGIAGTTNKTISGRADKLPNVYYIILDAYGRADILNKVYGYDNSGFIDYLKRKGFYVAEKSKSNYGGTFLSLASSLNSAYLGPAYLTDVMEKIRRNKVFSFMKEHGYINVFISSLDNYVRMSNADFKLRIGWLDDFLYELIDFTPIPNLLNRLSMSKFSHNLHRERINFAFDAIADTAGRDAPVFVYAHIFAPHPPFLFGPNGEDVQPDGRYSTHDSIVFYADGGTHDEYIKGYRGQIEYINKRLIKLIDHILAKKDNFSIIILQGDHGPRSGTDISEHYSILNAYYLPGNGSKALYESITPVNTFRLIFNLYFGEDYDLLEDRSYMYDDTKLPPAIIDVTDKVDSGK